jgi:FkbM family methyltransferase
MSYPKVSICIPAYKKPELMATCLESISNQTFTNYEVVITDDSPDNAVGNVVNNFKDRIKNIKYYKNEKRLGSPENWNECVKKASGDYIKIIHCDDHLSSKYSLEKYVKMLDENPNADFAFSSSNAINDGKKIIYTHKPSRRKINNLVKNIGSLFAENFIGAPSATIYRKNKIQYDKNLKWLVDVDFYMTLLNTNSNFIFIEEPLINISVEEDRVTNKCVDNKCLNFFEYFYIYNKSIINHIKIKRGDYLKAFWNIIKHFNITNKYELTECNLSSKLSLSIIFLINMNKFKRVFVELFTIKKNIFLKKYEHLSYSQCGEDIIISYIFKQLGIKKPSYLDLGAHHPKYLSNTYLLYKNGGVGVCVEPDPTLFKVIKNSRKRDTCLNIGVGIDSENKDADFYIMSAKTLNTFSKKEAERFVNNEGQKIESIIKISTLTVNKIISENFKNKPNFISVDIEGLDFEVLKSFNFQKYRPEVFCVETLTYTKKSGEQKLKNIIDFMQNNDYFVYADTYINTIFVDKNTWNNRCK